MSDIATHLNERLLANALADQTDLAPDSILLPAEIFHCADRHAAERRALFAGTPQPVAFSGELPGPGTYLALDILEQPVLLCRDEQGTLHAMINACAHRGAPLAPSGESGQRRTLVCPFHGWSYALDGSLRGRPGDEHFTTTPAAASGLERLAVSERGGIIVVAPSPDIPQSAVDETVEEVAGELAECGFEQYRVLTRRDVPAQANWKLVNDLSLESYHFATLHRDSVARMLTAHAVHDHWERSSRWAFPLQSIGELANLPRDEWPQDLQGSRTYTLYPGVMVILNALGAQMIRAEPGAEPGQCRVTYTGMRHPDGDEDAARSACEFGAEVFFTEDLPMAEACQRGLAGSRRALPVGRNEPLVQFWHRLWDRAVTPG